jgi:hypothetical protein
MDRKTRKGLAKSAVLTPEYRSRVERDRTKFSKHDRKKTKKALKKGLYFKGSTLPTDNDSQT